MSSSSSTPNSGPYSTSSAQAAGTNALERKSLTPKKQISPRSRGSRPFTTAMQDKQARNKDPYSSSDESEEGSWGSPDGKNRRYRDTYEQAQKRREAAVILDNPELLMMHAQARFDSISGTRHYFTSLMAGYLSPSTPYSAAEAAALPNLKGSHSRRRDTKDQDRRCSAPQFPDLEDRWVDQADVDAVMAEGREEVGNGNGNGEGGEQEEWGGGASGDEED